TRFKRASRPPQRGCSSGAKALTDVSGCFPSLPMKQSAFCWPSTRLDLDAQAPASRGQSIEPGQEATPRWQRRVLVETTQPTSLIRSIGFDLTKKAPSGPSAGDGHLLVEFFPSRGLPPGTVLRGSNSPGSATGRSNNYPRTRRVHSGESHEVQ